MLTNEQKVAHLLRRLGLGAGLTELQTYLPLGVEGTLDKLIQWEKTDEGFGVSPWAFAAYPDGSFQLDPTPLVGWWSLRMLLSKRPLQQRLTMFWHDHFAISAEKVADGPAVLDYLIRLHEHAGGSFAKLTREVCTSAAMVFYLDTHLSSKEHPNENFARELMELFTLGVGNYTEADIKEMARCFTGWSIHYAGIGTEDPFPQKQQEMARLGRSVFSFCWVPEIHDEGIKKVLGKQGNFGPDQALQIAIDHPATAHHICRKLARWFIGKPVSDGLVDLLAKEFVRNGYEIRPVVRMIAESDEFWKPEVVLNVPKSPIDFTVGMFRQFGINDLMRTMFPSTPMSKSPIQAEMKGLGQGIGALMLQQGLLLLYPPNVGGWDWGEAWISADSVKTRINQANVIFVGEDKNRPLAQWMANRLKTELGAKSDAELVNGFLKIFDGDLPQKSRLELTALVTKMGGLKALDDKESAAQLFAALGQAVFAAPRFQMC